MYDEMNGCIGDGNVLYGMWYCVYVCRSCVVFSYRTLLSVGWAKAFARPFLLSYHNCCVYLSNVIYSELCCILVWWLFVLWRDYRSSKFWACPQIVDPVSAPPLGFLFLYFGVRCLKIIYFTVWLRLRGVLLFEAGLSEYCYAYKLFCSTFIPTNLVRPRFDFIFFTGIANKIFMNSFNLKFFCE